MCEVGNHWRGGGEHVYFIALYFFFQDLKAQRSVLKQKNGECPELVEEIEDKTRHKELLIQKIGKLKQEQAKNRECMLAHVLWCNLYAHVGVKQGVSNISVVGFSYFWFFPFLVIHSQNQANKSRLKNLNKIKDIFQEWLSLEIRKIQGKLLLVLSYCKWTIPYLFLAFNINTNMSITVFVNVCLCEGDRLQFVFRNINHRNPESAYTFLLRINQEGVYQSKSVVFNSIKISKQKGNIFICVNCIIAHKHILMKVSSLYSALWVCFIAFSEIKG